MSPTNSHSEFEQDQPEREELLETHRDNSFGNSGASIQRTKRIRSAKRSNSVNGMQRRRNKRIDW